MMKWIAKRSRHSDLSPGTLVHIGKSSDEPVRISLIAYNADSVEEKEISAYDEILFYKNSGKMLWINVDGLYQTQVIEKIGNIFGIHPMTLEDILNTTHRPKMEELDGHIFITFKMLCYKVNEEDKDEIEAEQLSLIFGDNFLLSFQEEAGDVFDPIRERIRKGKGRIRNAGSDYLAYVLSDAITDQYFEILEFLDDMMESSQEELLSNPTPQLFQEIHDIKREIIFFRRQVWPLREIFSNLANGDLSLVHDSTRIYLNDLRDNVAQVIDAIESFRDILSSMTDIYLSSVSNRMNEVMKVLTVISTIFIPLTFIAGVYGMNFKYMPELELQWGYFGVLGLMFGAALLMILWFKRKKWL